MKLIGGVEVIMKTAPFFCGARVDVAGEGLAVADAQREHVVVVANVVALGHQKTRYALGCSFMNNWNLGGIRRAQALALELEIPTT